MGQILLIFTFLNNRFKCLVLTGLRLRLNARFFVSPFLLILVVNPSIALAQALPDAGQLQRSVDESTAVERERELPAAVVESSEEAEEMRDTGEAAPTVFVSEIIFRGNTLVGEADLEAVVWASVGQKLNFRQMQALTRDVREAYQEAGYLARVVLPEQDLAGGRLIIQIEEMKLGTIRVPDDGTLPIQASVIEGMGLAGQEPGGYLQYAALKRSASLINNLPGMRSELILERGVEPLSMNVVVPVMAEQAFGGVLSLDNFGSESTGEVRALGRVVWSNPLKRGDALSAVTLISEGNRYLGGDYSVPVGYQGWRVGVHASALDYELVGAFEYLEASGNSVVAGVHASYPIRLESRESLMFSTRFEVRSYYNEVGGSETSDKLLTLGEFGLNWLKEDAWFGGGRTILTARVRAGEVDLSGNAANERQDAQDAQIAGTFIKFEWSATRVQLMPYGLELQARASGQQAFDSLDSSETFSLGGPGGVRAYPTLEGNMDSAVLGSVELSRALSSAVRVSAFYDVGNGYLHSTLRRGKDSTLLHGAGVSILAGGNGPLSGEVSASRRIGDNPNADPNTGFDQDGTLREWRLWASVSLKF